MKKHIGLFCMILLVSGCMVMGTYSDSKKGIATAKTDAASAKGQFDVQSAVYVTEPLPNLQPIERKEGPEWVHLPLREFVEVAQIPLDIAVENLLASVDVITQFDHGTDPAILVSFSHSGSIKGALDKIAARTNYSYSVTDKLIKWQAYETMTFSLPLVGGDYSYMLGKKKPMDEDESGSSSAGGGGGISVDTSAFDVDRKQYSNTEGIKLNPFTDAEKTLNQIVGDYGTVVPSVSSSTILVKTTPDRMRVVKEYMEGLIEELSTQVLLEIKVIQVSTDNNADVGIDWASVKETTRSQLNFVGETAGSLFTDSVPVAFSGTRESGSGSVNVLLSALEQQGQVSFITEQRVLSRSGKVAEIELADIKGYLAQSRTTQTTDVGSTTELIPGIIQGGYTLYSLSKAFGDQVSMVISTRSSSLEPTETVGTAENFIELPRMKSNRFNIQQIVSSGTTVVAAAIRREENMSSQSSPLRVGLASTQAGARHRVTDIYLLITPRIIKNI